MSQAAQSRPSVLDEAQLLRIEAMHRGFLFQHLYAAQCLLSARGLSAKTVVVESDEDIEITLEEKHAYIQVKYRKEALAWGDIESAMTRFTELRGTHQKGDRQLIPMFIVISNVVPNAPLLKRINAADWPTDIRIDWPGAISDDRVLPAPQSSLMEAVEATRTLAQSLPFALLTPETLVWKLTGMIMLAATGENKSLNHIFKTEDLPNLFEQLVLQLHDLPTPPTPYRIQQDEPALLSAQRIRLISGYSGAGKTSWLAQSAQHTRGPLIYLDVADTPSVSLASTMAREIAGRLFAEGQQLGQVLLPGASGREILQIISRLINESGNTVMVALDNVHKLSSDDLIGAIKSASSVQFVLLCRPEGEIGAIEAHLGIVREELKGWSSDTVASAAADANCGANAADCQRLIDLTGGLPLYILNGLVITNSDYDGNLKNFCTDLTKSAHSREVAQETILGRVFNDLPAAVAEVADLLSLCDAPITREEASVYIVAVGGPDKTVVLLALRHLLSQGLLQSYAGEKIKIHDAARVVGKGRIMLLGTEALNSRRTTLRDIIQISLLRDWSSAKLSLFLRLCGETGRLDILAELATDEMFHEIGVWPEIELFLEEGAQNETFPPEQRIMALDGLAFADIKTGSPRASVWLDQMDALIKAYSLGSEEHLRVGMKRMTLLSQNVDREGSERLIKDLAEKVKNASPAHRRVYTYNVAAAELLLGKSGATIRRIMPLILEYYDLIGLAPEQVIGKNAPELRQIINKKPLPTDDIKHLADSLDVLAKAMDKEGEFSAFTRINALKFYDLVRAPDSLFRVGQDLVDQFISRNDYDGALEMMEKILLPQLQQWKLAKYLIPIRSQYAVVLAYCKKFSDATAEMARLQPYEKGLDVNGKEELIRQRDLIAQLNKYGPPPKWTPPPGLIPKMEGYMQNAARAHSFPITQTYSSKKIGRNEPCPCGSGEKYKRCHGG